MSSSNRFIASILRITKRPTGYLPQFLKHTNGRQVVTDRSNRSSLMELMYPTGSFLQHLEYQNVRQVLTAGVNVPYMSDRFTPSI